MNHRICSCLMALFLMIPNLHAQRMIEVDTRHLGASIQPTMWGIFFEDINFGADGGLYADESLGKVTDEPHDCPQDVPHGATVMLPQIGNEQGKHKDAKAP